MSLCSHSPSLQITINPIKSTKPISHPLSTPQWGFARHQFRQLLATTNIAEISKPEPNEHNPKPKPRFKWIKTDPNNITQQQQHQISQLSPKLTNRCLAILKQIICFSPQMGDLSDFLDSWVRFMKPIRADWLAVLKVLKTMQHPLYIQVAELALQHECFEPNIRDYTKIIHAYGKLNNIKGAENTLEAMKIKGFDCDQVTLTAMIDMYSKTGDHLKQAEETFSEIKLLGQQLDKRSYGSMIMAYIRVGMPEQGESLIKEMDTLQIYAGSEVYKALLRAYSMNGNYKGAQRVFEAIQFAGITPDARLCALLINAYQMAGESQKAYIAFENMRKAGVEVSDKCVALVLAAFEKEKKIDEAMRFLVDLERNGIVVGREGSAVLAGWFRRLGVVDEVESVLREFAGNVKESVHSSSHVSC